MSLGQNGLLVLLTGAHDAAAGPLLRLLDKASRQASPSPPVHVLFQAPELMLVPLGSWVVLVAPGAHARWLNVARPVVAERRLTLLLWCDERDTLALRQNAPDFYDWISHRIELPELTPTFLTAAVTEAEAHAGLIAVLGAGAPPATWQQVPADAGFQPLSEAAIRGPLWVTGVRDANDWILARAAHAANGAAHGLVFADPAVVGPDEPCVDARPVPWAAAAELLRSRGSATPGLDAALLDLSPAVLGIKRDGPVRLLPNPAWDQLLNAARQGPTPQDVTLAEQLGLRALTRAWRPLAGAPTTVSDLLNAARGASREGERERAWAHVREAAAIAARANDAHQLAMCRVEEALLLNSEGAADEALGLLTEQAIPVFLSAGQDLGLADAWSHVADIYAERGRLKEALSLYTDTVLPPFERAAATAQVASIYSKIAHVHQLRGEYDEAMKIRAVRTLPQYLSMGDRTAWALDRAQDAEVHAARGDIEEALGIHRDEVLPVHIDQGNVPGQTVTQARIARLLTMQGHLDDALALLTSEVLPAFTRLGDSASRAVTLGHVADIHRARGEYAEALRIITEEQIPELALHQDRYNLAVARGRAADLYVAQGQLGPAHRLITEEVLPALREVGDRRSEAVALERLADIVAARGDNAEARRILREEVLPLFTSLGAEREAITVRAKIALSDLTAEDPTTRAAAQALLLAAHADAGRSGYAREQRQIEAILSAFAIPLPDPPDPKPDDPKPNDPQKPS